MSSTLERLREPSKASKPVALFNLARMPVFIAIQALAAMALDGWLSLALWVNSAYNAFLMVAFIVGLTFAAVDAANEEAS